MVFYLITQSLIIFSLHLKDEALDFLEEDTIKNLIKKYSQFINFNIYLWCSKTIEVDEEEEVKPEAEKPEAEETESKESEAEKSEAKKSEAEKSEDDEDEEVNTEDEEDDGKVEEVKEEKPKKKIKKTVWDWELLNDSKPIWTLKPSEITDAEYNEFYKSLTKDKEDPLAKIHFVAEGEVTFKSLLFIPKIQPSESLSRYGTKGENIKLYVRRVFITDKFSDMMPNYLAFIRGIVDSDDLPLNVSRENLQQHKLIKIIKKKLIRKVLDMIKKISKEDYDAFWKEYSTNIKLGVIEDSANRARLSKLLKFKSSNQKEQTFLSDYVSRMKPTQRYIYYLGGITEEEIRKSPFVERLIKKGYEVLFLTEAVDEHAIVTIPEFEGKRFHNIAKEGFVLDESPEAQQKLQELKSTFEPLTKWLDDVLKDYISKAQISERLSESPCALIASYFGWTGNMERLASSNAHKKAEDSQASHYLSQKKTMEINPRHPLIKELLRRVEDDPNDQTAKDIALLMFKTATLRSGYMLRETHSYARSVEQLMKKSLGIPVDEAPEEEDDDVPEESAPSEEGEEADEDKEDEEHDEL